VIVVALVARIDYVPLIQSLIPFLGIIAAAGLAVWGYRKQKGEDLRTDQMRRKEEAYVRFLTCFGKAKMQPLAPDGEPRDPAKREKAEEEYYSAYNDMLLLASENVLERAIVFHQEVVKPRDSKPDETDAKAAYAKLISAMRTDCFERTTSKLTDDELRGMLPFDLEHLPTRSK
jgi:hypothetical protein